MDAITLMLAVLMAAAVLLFRSHHERIMGVFFIIRSGYGIRLIDSIAKLRPRLWEFLADFSVLLSFGGMGAFYLSSHNQSRGNLNKGVLLSGGLFAAASAYMGRADAAAGIFVFSAAVYLLMARMKSPLLDFLLSAAYLGFACAQVFDMVIAALFGIFGLPAVMIFVMSTHGLNILSEKTTLPGVSPMLPSARDGNVGVGFPGYDLFIPWWHVLIALFITLVVHEGAHGVLIRTAKVKLKSTGILTFLSMPIGAFVEPDEEHLGRKRSVDRMRVFTMGSFANLLTGFAAAAAIVIIMGASQSMIYSDGMRIVGFMDGYPAKGVIPKDTVIYSVNGKPTSDLEVFRNATGGLKAGDTIQLNTSSGAYSIGLVQDKAEGGKGMMGVYLSDDIRVRGMLGLFVSVGVLAFILESLGWVAFFNINIALVNLLPVVPFDGGRMFKEVVSTLDLSKAAINRVTYASAGLMAVLFLVNVLPLLKMLTGFVFSLV
jgi:membrane-associated protease RseP (regulator of RpoE activity)